MLTVVLQIYYFLWILLFGSFVYFMIRRKYINTACLGEQKILFFNNVGIVISIIALLYYVLICGLLGWEFKNITISYFVTFIIFILLDIFLLGFNSKKYKKSINVKYQARLWLPLVYTITRITYISLVLFTLFFSFLGGIFAAVNSIFYVTITTPEMFIDFARHTVIRNTNSNLFIYRSKWERDFKYGDLEPLVKSREYYFGDNLFCVMMYTDNPDSSFDVHIYKSRLLYFKKYLYTVRGKSFKTGLHYSSDGDTLFIGQTNNQNPQNFIVKIESDYMHTITRLSNASGLNYDQINQVSFDNNPDRFTIEKRIIR